MELEPEGRGRQENAVFRGDSQATAQCTNACPSNCHMESFPCIDLHETVACWL